MSSASARSRLRQLSSECVSGFQMLWMGERTCIQPAQSDAKFSSCFASRTVPPIKREVKKRSQFSNEPTHRARNGAKNILICGE